MVCLCEVWGVGLNHIFLCMIFYIFNTEGSFFLCLWLFRWQVKRTHKNTDSHVCELYSAYLNYACVWQIYCTAHNDIPFHLCVLACVYNGHRSTERIFYNMDKTPFYWCSFFMWTVSLWRYLKVFPHDSQLNGLYVWVLRWTSKRCFFLKDWSHNSQEYGLSTGSLIMCLMNSQQEGKNLKHCLQKKGFAPMSIFRWRLRSLSRPKDLKQDSQE